MRRSFHTDGIVLRNYRFGETHKGLTFLSPDQGLVDAVAFGGYSPKGKLRTVTDPLCMGTFYLYRDPVKNLIKVTDVDCQTLFPGIRQDVRKFFHASLFLETVLKTFGGESAAVYHLLEETLTFLEGLPEETASILLIQFFLRYLSHAGLSPNWEVCGGCGKELAAREPRYFRRDTTELFCVDCSHAGDDPLPYGSVAYVLYTRARPLGASLDVGLERDACRTLKLYLLGCIQQLAQTPLNSIRAAEGFL